MKLKPTMKTVKLIFAFISIMVLLVFAFLGGIKYKENENEKEQLIDNFSLDYKNETNHSQELRLKYVLNYKMNIAPNEWDYDDTLFALYKKEEKVHEKQIDKEIEQQFIPISEVSDSFTLNKNKKLLDEFSIEVNPAAKDFQDNVRFEAEIIVEELKEGKWSPIYQVIYMSRGPYWSLDKGPIEKIKDEK